MTPKVKATPRLPRSKANPVGGSRLVAGWSKDFERRLKAFFKALDAEIDSLVTVEEGMQINARRYLYLIDPAELLATINRLFDELVGPAFETFREAITQAYQTGSVEGRQALKTLLDDTRDLTTLLREVPFLRRLAYTQARVFEKMRGFSGEAQARLGTRLLESVSAGKSIPEVKRILAAEFPISLSRASRIARTEIIGALRRGRVDESRETAETYGVEIGLMWFSALSSTTRESHAARHGKVYTPDEVQEFYTEEGNAINCKCAQVEVILKDGKPLQEKLVARETARRQDFEKNKDKSQ